MVACYRMLKLWLQTSKRSVLRSLLVNVDDTYYYHWTSLTFVDAIYSVWRSNSWRNLHKPGRCRAALRFRVSVRWWVDWKLQKVKTTVVVGKFSHAYWMCWLPLSPLMWFSHFRVLLMSCSYCRDWMCTVVMIRLLPMRCSHCLYCWPTAATVRDCWCDSVTVSTIDALQSLSALDVRCRHCQ